jgi:hypothetical protein
MRRNISLWLIVLLVCLFALPACSAYTEKDVVGKWTNAKSPHIWMEFFPDKTCSGGTWSLAKDGTIKIVNPDGNVVLAKLQDGAIIIAEFGEHGKYIKESKP